MRPDPSPDDLSYSQIVELHFEIGVVNVDENRLAVSSPELNSHA